MSRLAPVAPPALIIREKDTLGKNILGKTTFITKNGKEDVSKTMTLKLIYKLGDSNNPSSNLINFIIKLYKIKKLYVCKINDGRLSKGDAFFCIDEIDGIKENTFTDFLDIKDIKYINFVTNSQTKEEYIFKIISNESIFKNYSYRHEIYNGKPLIEYYNLLEKEIQIQAQNEPDVKFYQPHLDQYDFTKWPKSGGGRKKANIEGRLAITLREKLYDNDVGNIWEEYIKENLLSNKIKTKEYKKVMGLFKKYISDPYNDNSNPEYNIMPRKDGLKHVNYFGLPLLHAYIKRYETMNDLLPSKIKNKITDSLKSLENNREFKGGAGENYANKTIMEPFVPTQYMQPQMQSGVQQGVTLKVPNPQNQQMMPQQMMPLMPPQMMAQQMGPPPMPLQMGPPMPLQMGPPMSPPMGSPMPQQMGQPMPMFSQMPPMSPPMGSPMSSQIIMQSPMSSQIIIRPPTNQMTMSQPPIEYAIPNQVSPSSEFPPLSSPMLPSSLQTTYYQNTIDVYRSAWIIEEDALYRFNGFFYMKYDSNDSNVSNDSNGSNVSNDTKNSFRILCLNEYHKNRIGKNKDKNIPHTLIFANKITNESKIYLCDKDNLYKNINLQSNKSIIAEILNENEQIYIFFENKLHNVTEINFEPKYKNDFELLNIGIKKVIEEYKAISANSKIKEMFELYSKLEEQLENISNSNNDIDTVVRLYKEELNTRNKLCEIILKNNNGTINEKIEYYKTILGITIRNISETIKSLSESEQRIFINLLQKNSSELMKKIELYGKYFMYFNEKTKTPSYFFGR